MNIVLVHYMISISSLTHGILPSGRYHPKSYLEIGHTDKTWGTGLDMSLRFYQGFHRVITVLEFS